MGRATIALSVFLASCGARTGLEVPAFDAGIDAGRQIDAGPLPCPSHVNLLQARAEVVLVLDRSGSMTRELAGAGVTRDQALRGALAATLPTIDETIAFGALLYPIDGATLEDGTACTLAAGALDVAIALGASGPVLAALAAHGPMGGTPTRDAIVRASEALAGRVGSFAPAIVLATDGGPNCDPIDEGEPWYGLAFESCVDSGYPLDRCLDDERTVDAITGARRDGIPTYVIGMDVTIPRLVAVLDEMAVAGGRPREGARRFYDASDPAGLTRALEEIAAEVSACTYVPDVSIDPATGTVHVDGVPSTGWSLGPEGAIQLTGELCAQASRPGARLTFGPACDR